MPPYTSYVADLAMVASTISVPNFMASITSKQQQSGDNRSCPMDITLQIAQGVIRLWRELRSTGLSVALRVVPYCFITATQSQTAIANTSNEAYCRGD